MEIRVHEMCDEVHAAKATPRDVQTWLALDLWRGDWNVSVAFLLLCVAEERAHRNGAAG